MIRFILIFALTFLFSCALNSGSRKNISNSEVIFKGGIFQEKSWDEKLVFKRYSWFNEATMQYDILITEIEDNSKFALWLGRDSHYAKECSKLYVTALYSDINIGEGVTFLASKFEKLGMEKKSLLDFSENFKAHNNYRDWRLYNYKIFGFCKKDTGSSDIAISIPGFRTKHL